MVSAIARGGRRRPRPGAAWRNWAGNQTMRPSVTSSPVDVDQVRTAVLRAREARGTLKMSGTGHSFTPIALTDGELLLPDRLRGEISVDLEAMTATAPAGTPLHVLNRALEARGVTLHNMGDIAEQTLAGAVSTGTHGSGGVAAGLAAQVVALTLVSGTGETLRLDARTDASALSLAVVGLGALGVVTELTFAVEPLLLMRATEEALRWSEAVDRLPELVAAHHHVDLHWFPHTDGVLVKRNDRLDAPLEAAQPLGALRRWWDDELMANGAYGAMVAAGARVPALVPAANAVALRAAGARTYSDVPHRVLTSPRRFRFREMEYAVPWEAAPAVLAAVRRRIADAPWRIGIPVEIRTAAPDAVALSTAAGRRSVYLAFHLPARLDPSDYFDGVEPILRAHEGRPHWGKLHTLAADDLAGLYPRFGDFLALRERLDPDRVFANDHLRRVLGD